jgi:hypothetical protein
VIRRGLPACAGAQFLERGLPVAERLLGLAVFAQRLGLPFDRRAHRREEPVALPLLGRLVGGERRAGRPAFSGRRGRFSGTGQRADDR